MDSREPYDRLGIKSARDQNSPLAVLRSQQASHSKFKMFKLISFLVLVAAVSGGVVPAAPLIASAPAVAIPAPIVTARSSQVVARNYNTFAAAPLVAAAPAVAHVAAPLTYAAPAHYAAAPAHYAVAAPIKYAAPLTYAAAAPAHLTYAAAPGAPLIF